MSKARNLYKAIQDKRIEEAKELISQMNPEEFGEKVLFADNVLHMAATYGPLELFESIFEKAPLHVINSLGSGNRNILHIALHNRVLSDENVKICKSLLEKMNRDIINTMEVGLKNTILHQAVFRNSPKIISEIIKVSPSIINLKNQLNETALDIALTGTLFKAREEISKILISNGAELSINPEIIEEYREGFKFIIAAINAIDYMFDEEQKISSQIKIDEDLYDTIAGHLKFKLQKKLQALPQDEIYGKYEKFIQHANNNLPEELSSQIREKVKEIEIKGIKVSEFNEILSLELAIVEAQLVSLLETSPKNQPLSDIPYKILKLASVDGFSFQSKVVKDFTPYKIEKKTIKFYEDKKITEIGAYLTKLLNDENKLKELSTSNLEVLEILIDIKKIDILSQDLFSILDKILKKSAPIDETQNVKETLGHNESLIDNTIENFEVKVNGDDGLGLSFNENE